MDASVPKSEVPAISGTDVDEQNAEETLPQITPAKISSGSLLTQPNPTIFVAPVAFYGKVLDKPKTGPLYVRPANIPKSHLKHDSIKRHDPAAEGSIVMKSPSKEHEKKFNSKFVVFTSDYTKRLN